MHFLPTLIQNKMKIFVRFTNLLSGVLSYGNAAQKNQIPDFIGYLVGVVANLAIVFRKICSLIHSLGYYSLVEVRCRVGERYPGASLCFLTRSFMLFILM